MGLHINKTIIDRRAFGWAWRVRQDAVPPSGLPREISAGTTSNAPKAATPILACQEQKSSVSYALLPRDSAATDQARCPPSGIGQAICLAASGRIRPGCRTCWVMPEWPQLTTLGGGRLRRRAGAPGTGRGASPGHEWLWRAGDSTTGTRSLDACRAATCDHPGAPLMRARQQSGGMYFRWRTMLSPGVQPISGGHPARSGSATADDHGHHGGTATPTPHQ